MVRLSMYFYRLGHSPKISIAEITTLGRNFSQKDLKYELNDKFLLTDYKIPITQLGGTSYAGEFWGWLEYQENDNLSASSRESELANTADTKLLQNFKNSDRQRVKDNSWMNKLKQILDDRTETDFSKQMGISAPAKLAKKIIPTLRQYGVKKVNLLVDEEPNFGHLKGYPWLIISEFIPNSVVPNTTKSGSKKYFVGLIDQVAPQDIFKFLDMRSPAGNMKRGLMNLKLAKSMLSLASEAEIEYIWDPFCGQGGILLVNQIFEQRPILGTDLEKQAVKFTKENMAWLETRAIDQIEAEFHFPTPDNQVLHIERMDAGRLAEASRDSNLAKIIRKIEPRFDFSKTAIVTEGTLGPIYDRQLPSSNEELVANLQQITELWRKTLVQARQLGIPELVFTLPFYRLPSDGSARIDPKQLEGLGYEIVPLDTEKVWLDYFRPKTMVGHMILKMKIN